MITPNEFYKTGGSLSANASSYVKRSADDQLLQEIKKGSFCYVLTSRQMGKSSLMVQTSKQLREAGWLCVAVDISQLGVHHSSPEDWYYTLLLDIAESLDCEDEFDDWWSERSQITYIKRVVDFWEAIVLKATDQPVAVFFDEIDSMLSLDKDHFSTDDFFAGLRAVYNKKALNEDLERIHFCILGVATPDDLMTDAARTPFNIGIGIPLENLTMEEAKPLLPGLEGLDAPAEEWLSCIMDWTGGQPYLTQVLANWVYHLAPKDAEPSAFLDQSVKERLIAPGSIRNESNLENIQRRIKENEEWQLAMLDTYEHLLAGKKIKADLKLSEQVYLKLTGLVVEKGGLLVITNEIYRQVFNQAWIDHMRAQLKRHFSSELSTWEKLGRNEDALLKGQVLAGAIQWAEGRDDLTPSERDFLEASRIHEIKTVEQERQRRGLYVALTVMAVLLVVALSAFIYASDQSKKARQSASEALRLRDLADSTALVANKERENAETQAEKNLELAVALQDANKTLGEKSDSLQIALREANYQKNLAQQKTMEVLENQKANGYLAKALEYRDDDPTYALHLIREGSKVNPGNSSPYLVASKILASEKIYKKAVSLGFYPGGAFYAPVSDRIVLYSDDYPVVRMIDLEGNVVQELKGHVSRIVWIAHLANSSLLLTIDHSNLMKLWRWEGGQYQLINTIQHYRPVKGAFSRENSDKVYFIDRSGMLHSWAFNYKKTTPVRRIFSQNVSGLKASPDGNWLAVEMEASDAAYLLKVPDKPEIERFTAAKRFLNESNSGYHLTNNSLITFSSNGTPSSSDLRYYEGRTLAQDNQQIGSSNGNSLSGTMLSIDKSIVYDNTPRAFSSPPPVQSGIFRPKSDKNILASRDGRNVVTYNTEKGELLLSRSYQNEKLKLGIRGGSGIQAIDIAPSNKSFFTLMGTELLFWDLGENEKDKNILYQASINSKPRVVPDRKTSYPRQSDRVWAMAIIPGTPFLVTGRKDGVLSMLDRKGEVRDTIKQSHPITSIELSPNGRWIATGNTKGKFMIYEMRNNRFVEKNCKEGDLNVSLPENGRDLAEIATKISDIYPDYKVRNNNYELENGKEALWPWFEEDHYISQLKFTPDSRSLIMSSLKGCLYKVNVADGSIDTIYIQNNPIYDFEMIPNGPDYEYYVTNGGTITKIDPGGSQNIGAYPTDIVSVQYSEKQQTFLIGCLGGAYLFEGSNSLILEVNSLSDLNRQQFIRAAGYLNDDEFIYVVRNGVITIKSKEGKTIQNIDLPYDFLNPYTKVNDILYSEKEDIFFISNTNSNSILQISTIMGVFNNEFFAAFDLEDNSSYNSQAARPRIRHAPNIPQSDNPRPITTANLATKAHFFKTIDDSYNEKTLNIDFTLVEDLAISNFESYINSQLEQSNLNSSKQPISSLKEVNELVVATKELLAPHPYFIPFEGALHLSIGDTASVQLLYDNYAGERPIFLKKFNDLSSRLSSASSEQYRQWRNRFFKKAIQELQRNAKDTLDDYLAELYYEILLVNTNNVLSSKDYDLGFELYLPYYYKTQDPYVKQQLFDLTRRQLSYLTSQGEFEEFVRVFEERKGYFSEYENSKIYPSLFMAYLSIHDRTKVEELLEKTADLTWPSYRGNEESFTLVLLKVLLQSESDVYDLEEAEFEWAFSTLISEIREKGYTADIQWAKDYFEGFALYPGAEDSSLYKKPQKRLKTRLKNFEESLSWKALDGSLSGSFTPYIDFSAHLIKEQDWQNHVGFSQHYLAELDTTSKYRLIPNLALSYLQLDSIRQFRELYRRWGPELYPDQEMKRLYVDYDYEDYEVETDLNPELRYAQFDTAAHFEANKDFYSYYGKLAELREDIQYFQKRKERHQKNLLKYGENSISFFETFWYNLNFWKEEDQNISFDFDQAVKILLEEWVAQKGMKTREQAWVSLAPYGLVGIQALLLETQKNGFPEEFPVYEEELFKAYFGFISRLEREGDFLNGIALIKSLLDNIPDRIASKKRLYSYLAHMYLTSGQWEEAKKIYDRFRDEPEWFSTSEHIRKYRNLTSNLISEMELDSAIVFIEKLGAILPDNFELKLRLYPNLANAYLFSGKWEKAKEIYDQFLNEDYPIQDTYFTSYWGAFARTIVLKHEALGRYDFANWQGGNQRAQMIWPPGVQENTQKALGYLKANWMKSDNAKTLEDGGDFFTRNSADDEIQTVFKTGLDLYKKAFGKKGHSAALTEIKIPATYLRLTADLIRKGDYTEVLRMAEEATDMIEQGVPNNGRLYPAMVNAHLLLGQWEEAKAIIDRLSDLPYPLETYKNYKEAFQASIQYWSKGDLDMTLLDQALRYLEN